jgi:hypothetical protein
VLDILTLRSRFHVRDVLPDVGSQKRPIHDPSQAHIVPFYLIHARIRVFISGKPCKVNFVLLPMGARAKKQHEAS